MNAEQGYQNDEVNSEQTSLFIIPCSIFDIHE